MRGLEPKRHLPLLITQSSLSASGVLEILLTKLGERPRFKRSASLIVLEKHLADIDPLTLVIILDDAQNYPAPALEEIRMLLGIGGHLRSAFALILAGDELLQCGYLRADETEARFRDPDKPGTTGRGRFWLYKGLNGNVIFDWALGRDHQYFLDWIGQDFDGILGSDAYEVYPKYCRLQKARGKKTRRAACLAHIRRKFEEALKTSPHLARWFLKIFGKLYQIEATLQEQKADAKRKARYRQKHSLPLTTLLQKASLHLRDKKAGRPAGPLGKAVRYLLNQGDDIETYIHHGQVEIDNNGIERDVRPLAVGRKNWLFVGSPEAGERSAVIYSLLISARHHGADPEAYLRDLIDRLPSCGSDEASLRQLLPENWAAAQEQSARQESARVAA
jgi:hypothetical protein